MSANLDAQVRYAQLLAESTLIPRHLRGNPANVLLFLALAEAQEVMPAVAFSGFQIIGDTPTMKPEMMRAQILRHGHSLKYEQWDKTTCRLTGTRADNGDSVTVTWTIQKAKDAGLKPEAGTWAKYPEAMLSARATSELARSLFADCLNGISYTPEELGAEVDDEGKAVEAHARAMEDMARQPPPNNQPVERQKKAGPPAEDPFTAASVEDAPSPPPPWLDTWQEKVGDCTDLDELAKLYAEAVERRRTNRMTQADFEDAVVLKDVQKAAIERAAAEKASGWPDVAKPGDAA